MSLKRCPFCHSTNLEAEGDFNKFKEELRHSVNENPIHDPRVMEMVNDTLNYDLYDDDAYLENLSKHGLAMICKDCGYMFHELDEENPNWEEPTQISKEEFHKIILDKYNSMVPYSDLNENKEKEQIFLSMVCGGITKYYKQRALEIALELEKAMESVKFITGEDEGLAS